MRADRVGPERGHGPAGGGEGDRADHVGGACLVPGGRVRPLGPAEPDLADGAAAGQVGRGRLQPVPPSDQHARPVRCVQLVAGEREVVNPGLGQRDPPVRDQLRAVDHDPRAVAVRERGQLGQRRALAGDVRRAGDGQQRRRRGREFGLDGGDRLRAGAARPHGPGPEPLPRQQVGVVLDVEVDHAAGRVIRHRGREQVESVGGVAGEDHHVVAAGVDEPGDLGPGALVGAGADGGRVAGAAVHAGVERQQLGHPVGDGPQGRGAGGVVEVDVTGGTAAHERNHHVAADDLGQRRHRANGATGAPRRVPVRGRQGTAGQQESTFVVSGTAQDPIDAGPRLPVPAGTGRVLTRGTPAVEGCRPASRGLTLTLLTQLESYQAHRPGRTAD